MNQFKKADQSSFVFVEEENAIFTLLDKGWEVLLLDGMPKSNKRSLLGLLCCCCCWTTGLTTVLLFLLGGGGNKIPKPVPKPPASFCLGTAELDVSDFFYLK